MKYIRTSVMYLAVALMACAQPGYGQTVTTGTLNGVGKDQQGGVLSGDTVTVSDTLASCRVTGASVPSPRRTVTSLNVVVRNPGSSTVYWYGPPPRTFSSE